jgi:hypothetical protein
VDIIGTSKSRATGDKEVNLAHGPISDYNATRFGNPTQSLGALRSVRSATALTPNGMRAVDEELWSRKAKSSSMCNNFHVAGNFVGCGPLGVDIWSVDSNSVNSDGWSMDNMKDVRYLRMRFMVNG